MKREKSWQVWTGGIDSAVCFFEAKSPEFKLQGLLGLTFEGLSVSEKIMSRQAVSLEVPFFPLHPTQNDFSAESYSLENETELKAVLKQKKTESLLFSFTKESLGVKAAMNLADRLGVHARFPLWDWPAEEILRVFFNLRFEAFLVALDERKIPGAFLGKAINAKMIETLPKGLHLAGNRGEFASAVVNGPFFQNSIEPQWGQTQKYGNYLSFDFKTK